MEKSHENHTNIKYGNQRALLRYLDTHLHDKHRVQISGLKNIKIRLETRTR